MKAAILEDLNKIVVKEVADPGTENGGMLIKVKACAVCGSDIRIYRHGNPRVKPPQIIGHEIAGDVIRTGADVKDFKVGDRIATGADVPCGECSFCKAGMGNNCKINYAMGYQFQGGFAEYVPLNTITVKYGPVHKIPENVSYEEAALAEPLACCVNCFELVGLDKNETVVIIGAGPIGCMLAKLAKITGAKKVIIAQRSKARLDKALEIGAADIAISTNEEDLLERVMKETGGAGADVVVVACASADAQEQAVELAGSRGRINFFGGLPKGTRKITIDSNIIHYKEIMVTGSHGSVPRHHETALKLIAEGRINMKDFISHTFSLDEIAKAFETAENKEGMKVIIKP